MRLRHLGFLLALLLLAAGCGEDGGGDDEDAGPTTTAPIVAPVDVSRYAFVVAQFDEPFRIAVAEAQPLASLTNSWCK